MKIEHVVLGDIDTLTGTPEKPGKIKWLKEQGVISNGVHVISMPPDMLPGNLLNYHKKILKLLKENPGIKSVWVAALCWPYNNPKNQKLGVAGIVTPDTDFGFYALGICQALQKVYDQTGITVGMTYHPMQTWPTIALRNMKRSDLMWLQKYLRECEMSRREKLIRLMSHFGIHNVKIGVENEPPTSDPLGSLTHMGNGSVQEMVENLPPDWIVVLDVQHLVAQIETQKRILELNANEFVFAKEVNPLYLNLRTQFEFLSEVSGDILIHASQMDDFVRHITPPLRFEDPIMDWPLIFNLIDDLRKKRDGWIGIAAEEEGGHLYPEGYEMTLKSTSYLQNRFGFTA